MGLSVINGPTIEAGESLSDGIDCSGGDAVRITMPSDWTPANLTFQISTDGNGYNDLFTLEGNEVTAVVKPGAAVRISSEWAQFWNFIKFRSGTRDYPVEQKGRREFAVTLSTPDAPAAEGATRRTPLPDGERGAAQEPGKPRR